MNQVALEIHLIADDIALTVYPLSLANAKGGIFVIGVEMDQNIMVKY